MSLKSISRWLLAIGCVGALPLVAQTTSTSTTATTSSTTSTKTEARHVTHKAKTEMKETKAEEKKETKAEEKKENKASEHHEMKMAHHKARMAASGRLVMDATRLAAILDDSQSKASISTAALKTTANEANVLVGRVYAGARTASEKKAAREARTHVREMRVAAMKGDDAGAKSHAGMALPFVYQVVDAATK